MKVGEVHLNFDTRLPDAIFREDEDEILGLLREENDRRLTLLVSKILMNRGNYRLARIVYG